MPGRSTAESTPPSGSPAPQARKRGLRWKRLLLALSLLSLLGITGLGIAVWSVWTGRAGHARSAIKRLLPAFEPEVEGLQVSAGDVAFHGLSLREPDAEAPFLTLRSAELREWRQSLNQPRLGRVRIEGLHFRYPASRLGGLLEKFTGGPAQADEPGTGVSAQAQGDYLLEGLDLVDLQVELSGGDSSPSLSFTLDHSFDKLALPSAGAPALEHAEFHLRDLQLRLPEGGSVSLPELSVELSFDPHSGILHIHRLDVPQSTNVRLLPQLGALLPGRDPGAAEDGAGALPEWLKGVVLHKARLHGADLDASAGLPAIAGLPELRFRSTLEYECAGVEWDAAQGVSRAGSHEIRLTGLEVNPGTSEPGHLRAAAIDLKARHEFDAGRWVVEQASLSAPDLDWTPQFEAALLYTSAEETAALPARNPAAALLIASASLTDGRLRIQQTPLLPIDLHCRLEGSAQDLHLAGSRFTSPQAQRLMLSGIEIKIPGSGTAAPTTIESIEAVIRPDALLANGLIDRLHIEKPRLSYHLALDPGAGPAAAGPAAPLPPLPLDKLHFTHLGIADGTLQVTGKWGAEFEAETRFNLATNPPSAGDGPHSNHTLVIDETRLLATQGRPLPVARVGRFEVRARLPEVISQRRLESLTLTGGQVAFGEMLAAILDPGTTPPPQPAAPAQETAAASTKPKWSAGSVKVEDLTITLQKIAPGLPPLTFAVQFEARDTPLEPEGLVQNFDAQRIELGNLTIPSPYGLQRPVARLDTIFVHFTLDGLLRQRIDKVEILHPTLYVGEPLFWYVDYYRKYAAGGIKTDADAPKVALAAADDTAALAAAAAATDTTAAAPQRWTIVELQVHGGKLVLAPKGVPLPGFGQPFPFSFTTRLDSGQFDAVFDIPPDNYPFEDLKLEFVGMRGHLQFNMPMKDVDNNLTETFVVDQVRWKDLHVENAHLSVTYDLNGIYGKFGGEAYEGYVDGGFDVFLNDSYTWDGWISATNVKSTEITEKLTPAYLLLDGKVNGAIVATGDSKELYQADITCSNTASGRFSIAALNDMLATLPPPQSAALTDQLTRVGLETLRDFEYDKVEAKARLHGREGSGFLNISGPAGSRNFEVFIYDHRWKVDPPPADD